jgi:hypothetical protein
MKKQILNTKYRFPKSKSGTENTGFQKANLNRKYRFPKSKS